MINPIKYFINFTVQDEGVKREYTQRVLHVCTTFAVLLAGSFLVSAELQLLHHWHKLLINTNEFALDRYSLIERKIIFF